MCVRECGAKWREINARLRYAVMCALFTLLQLLKRKRKKINRSKSPENVASMVAEIPFIRFRKKETQRTRDIIDRCIRVPRVFRFSIKLQSASVGTKSWRLFGPRFV